MRKSSYMRYLDVFHSELTRDAQFSHVHEFPQFSAVYYQPRKALSFEKAFKTKNYRQWVHFYMHDRKFERIWNNPKKYLPLLRQFDGVITPDFSLYRELPLAIQIWNVYRNRAIGYWLQKNGISIVPNIRWSDERSYNFAFEGLAQGGTVAISTNGCIQGRLDRQYFKKGLAEMVRSLKPETIVNYSQTPDDIFGSYKAAGINIIELHNPTFDFGKVAN